MDEFNFNDQQDDNQQQQHQHNESNNDSDICRVCRNESTPDHPLFYPCVCTGSIKYIHQDCLLQWLKYSKKEYCELCKHKFSFAPIYHPDMPKRLPINDIITGLFKNIFKAIKFWLHSTLVAISWMGIVPLTASRIYRCLFTGSVSSLLTLPLDMLSTENIISDIFQGGFVVLCSLGAFISLVWLREQILTGGGPDWLDNQQQQQPPQPQPPQQQHENIGGVVEPLPRIRPQMAVEGGDIAIEQQIAPPVDDQQNNIQDIPPQRPPPAVAGQDDNAWNPIEWDRAAEDLTWDRLLGLDGSLLFLEHVFWVISLNTLFILVFAFCPYHMGHYCVYGFKLQDFVEKTHFEGLITTLIGYVLFAVILVVSYFVMSISSFYRARKIIGLCYIVIKVALLVVIEICLFPLVCGVWLDVCSLKLFNSTINERLHNFQATSGTSVFIHWLIGMVYVFYFATFVFLLREVLRPGVLWFLRNLNDPDFNPIQEMIQLPVFRHIKRFVTSVVLFGFSVVLMLFLPIKFISLCSSTFFPYNVSNSSESLASELSIELLWLHVVLPALLEQNHLRSWIKNLIRIWAITVAYLLDLKSFLLGDDPNFYKTNQQAAAALNQQNNQLQQQIQPNPFQFNIGVAHQALLQNNVSIQNQTFVKPNWFRVRITLLLIVICFSLFACSVSVLVIPVAFGRFILFSLTGLRRLHELYTIFTGLYTIWVTIRLLTMLYNWIMMDFNELYNRLKQKTILFVKTTLAILMMFGLIPLLLGLLFQHIVINPICCNHDQTPVISLWQVWALGVLHTKILTAMTLTGPQWWLKTAIERICEAGFRNIDLKFIALNLFYPTVNCLGLALSIPYVLAKNVAPFLISNSETLYVLERRIYPTMLFLSVLIGFTVFQLKQFKRLYERIRNDKYLVGQRLINFERSQSFPTNSQAISTTTT